MRLGTQIGVAGFLVALLGVGGLWYHRSQSEGEAAAAVGREQRAVPVEVAAAEDGVMRERIEAVGTTLARQAVDVVAMASGRVAEITFGPGERVEAGTVLVRLDDAAERADVAEAQAGLREAQLALDRARQLRSNNTVAQATVDELEAAFFGASARVDAAQKELDDRTVVAPFSGIVGIQGIDVGARIDDETVLTTLDDLSEVEIEFSVPETFFGQVRKGQLVTATSSAYPDRTFTGRVASIDSRIGEVSRAFRVRAVLPNPDLTLPAGMFMHVDVVLEERPAVLIPEESVIAEGDRTYVFTVQDQHAERRPVTLGKRTAGTVEVLEGLQAGEAVVRSGIGRLRDGSPVRLPGDQADAPAPGGGGRGA